MTFTVEFQVIEATLAGPVVRGTFMSPGMAQACWFFWKNRTRKVELRRLTRNQDGVVVLDEDVPPDF